jgi:hypothetical protein
MTRSSRAGAPAGVAVAVFVLLAAAATVPAMGSPVRDGSRSRVGRGAPAERARRHKKPDVKPEKLWSLYPLNPRAGRTPGSPRSAAPTPAPSARYGEENELPGSQALSPPAAQRSGGSSRSRVLWLAVAGIVVLCVMAVGLWLLRGRAVGAALPPVPAPRPRPVVQPPPAPAAPSPEPPVPPATHRRHVRVFLHDGRSIEGWRKESLANDDRVLVLDVEAVYDAAGERVPGTPLDSFVLPNQIERMESLEAAPAEQQPT